MTKIIIITTVIMKIIKTITIKMKMRINIGNHTKYKNVKME